MDALKHPRGWKAAFAEFCVGMGGVEAGMPDETDLVSMRSRVRFCEPFKNGGFWETIDPEKLRRSWLQ